LTAFGNHNPGSQSRLDFINNHQKQMVLLHYIEPKPIPKRIALSGVDGMNRLLS
jgi:hypothetical protein